MMLSCCLIIYLFSLSSVWVVFIRLGVVVSKCFGWKTIITRLAMIACHRIQPASKEPIALHHTWGELWHVRRGVSLVLWSDKIWDMLCHNYRHWRDVCTLSSPRQTGTPGQPVSQRAGIASFTETDREILTQDETSHPPPPRVEKGEPRVLEDQNCHKISWKILRWSFWC